MSPFAFRLNCKLAGCHVETIVRGVALNLRGLIDKLIGLVSANETLGQGERECDTLKNGLVNFKTESIGAACRGLVKSVVGEDGAVRLNVMHEI